VGRLYDRKTLLDCTFFVERRDFAAAAVVTVTIGKRAAGEGGDSAGDTRLASSGGGLMISVCEKTTCKYGNDNILYWRLCSNAMDLLANFCL
jgi:hypothetical protein